MVILPSFHFRSRQENRGNPFILEISVDIEKSAEKTIPADFFTLHTNPNITKASDFLILKID
jgi:hypothetical protein